MHTDTTQPCAGIEERRKYLDLRPCSTRTEYPADTPREGNEVGLYENLQACPPLKGSRLMIHAQDLRSSCFVPDRIS